MGRFYRFRKVFAIARNIIAFPAMMLTLWNLRFGWRKWHRTWRNDLVRFGGWVVMRRWLASYRKDTFADRLVEAQRQGSKGESPG
jgi:hypothetical protein